MVFQLLTIFRIWEVQERVRSSKRAGTRQPWPGVFPASMCNGGGECAFVSQCVVEMPRIIVPECRISCKSTPCSISIQQDSHYLTERLTTF